MRAKGVRAWGRDRVRSFARDERANTAMDMPVMGVYTVLVTLVSLTAFAYAGACAFYDGEGWQGYLSGAFVASNVVAFLLSIEKGIPASIFVGALLLLPAGIYLHVRVRDGAFSGLLWGVYLVPPIAVVLYLLFQPLGIIVLVGSFLLLYRRSKKSSAA